MEWRRPYFKKRAFGLTGNQGNHGEDVKEYYFYKDATPTHSFMRYLYKYPQAAYPYQSLVEVNGGKWSKNGKKMGSDTIKFTKPMLA